MSLIMLGESREIPEMVLPENYAEKTKYIKMPIQIYLKDVYLIPWCCQDVV